MGEVKAPRVDRYAVHEDGITLPVKLVRGVEYQVGQARRGPPLGPPAGGR